MTISLVFAIVAFILALVGAGWIILAYHDHTRGRPASRTDRY